MRTQVTLSVVLTWLSCTWGSQQRRSCSDCVGYQTCPAAVKLISKQEPAADAQFKSGFCGFDSSRLPMVCCAYLTNTPASGSGDDSVENHPNLRLLPDNCGKGEYDGDKIFGGRPAGLYEFPWMVLISYKIRQRLIFGCGGSLINDRYVLTAAHCIANQRVDALAGVRIGENDVDTTTDCEPDEPPLTCESNIQDLRIEEAIPHPQYQGKPNVRNDIGLLRLRKPVDLSFKNAGIVCLPITKQLQSGNLSGHYATVAGWGHTENGYISSKLLFVKVPIHTAESCRELYNRGAKPGTDETINKICAGQKGKDSCGGDSGGPLMVEDYYRSSRFFQHGIVSYGPRLCGSDFPGVYTDVSKYMKWILDTIKP